MTRLRRLQVVRSEGETVRRRSPLPSRRQRTRPRRIVDSLLLIAAGVLLLVVLLVLPERIDLNSLLLVSTAISHLIAGLSRLLMGLMQLLGVLLLAGIALLALLLLLGGLVGLLRVLVDPAAATPSAPGSERRPSGRS